MLSICAEFLCKAHKDFGKSGDVDIFVNDYYFFKSITGVRAMNTDKMHVCIHAYIFYD